jgi:energy-coupling factor transporter transmembrane protein EcfT
MRRSTKLGIASLILVGSVFIYPTPEWRSPISMAAVWIAIVLSLIAAKQGSKWWLVVPGVVFTVNGLLAYIAFHAS